MRRPLSSSSSSLLSSARRLTSTASSLRPVSTRAGPRSRNIFPFAAALLTAGVAWGLQRQHARSFSTTALLCEEQKKQDKDDGLFPSLPKLPAMSVPDMPKLSLSFDDTIKGWQESFANLSKAFTDLQSELTGGEGSTVAKILDSKDDPKVNEEIQWDATVRLGELRGLPRGREFGADPLPSAQERISAIRSERSFATGRRPRSNLLPS